MNDMSPTLRRVIETGKARDQAMQEAYDAEGTPAERAADQRYAAAELAHMDACREHRAARRAHGDNV